MSHCKKVEPSPSVSRITCPASEQFSLSLQLHLQLLNTWLNKVQPTAKSTREPSTEDQNRPGLLRSKCHHWLSPRSCDIRSLILITGNNQQAHLDQNYKQKPIRQKCYVLGFFFFTYFLAQTHHLKNNQIILTSFSNKSKYMLRPSLCIYSPQID